MCEKLPPAEFDELIESIAIKQTLQQTDGNKAQAAQALGIAVSTLYEKLRKYRLAGEKDSEAASRSASWQR